jgi:hypothetical protein
MYEEENDIYINFQLSFLPILSSFMKRKSKRKNTFHSCERVLIMGYPSCIKCNVEKAKRGKRCEVR